MKFGRILTAIKLQYNEVVQLSLDASQNVFGTSGQRSLEPVNPGISGANQYESGPYRRACLRSCVMCCCVLKVCAFLIVKFFQGWSGQVWKFSPPTRIRSVDHPPCNCVLCRLSSADPLLMLSFGSNETTSHPPKHLHVLYRLGIVIGHPACKSAVVSWCLVGEIGMVAPH